MKNVLAILLIFCCSVVLAQAQISPGVDFESKWLVERDWKMNMSMVSNKNTRNLGVIHYSWSKNDDDTYEIISEVALSGLPSKAWIDSLTINAKDLSPIRHNSINMQRNILIDYDKLITGYYEDKIKKVKTPFSYPTESPVFDSGFYLFLLQLLPLDSLSTPAEIDIFDFKPEGKQGFLKAFIVGIESGFYEPLNGEKIDSWIVKTYDTIGRGDQTVSFISKSARTLLKQETLDKDGNGMVLEIVAD